MYKLKPSILVALKGAVNGGITYNRVEMGREVAGDGSERIEWKTTKHVADPKELATADAYRNKAKTAIKRVCARTPWGLICPNAKEAELMEAIEQAHQLAAEFNSNHANHTEVTISVFLGRVAENDAEAAKAVRLELTTLLEQAERAASSGHVQQMRDLAKQGAQLEKLLEDGTDAKGALGQAIKGLRKVARDVVRLVEKKGEDMATVLTEDALKPVSEARFAFAAAVADTLEWAEDQLPAVNAGRFAINNDDAEPAGEAEEQEVEA